MRGGLSFPTPILTKNRMPLPDEPVVNLQSPGEDLSPFRSNYFLSESV